jgi:hypothetical protein
MLALALLTAAPAAAQAQAAVGAGITFQGYTLDEPLGVRSANLLLAPIAARVAFGNALSVDAYGAWARGAANIGGTEYTIEGMVDTRVRASLTVAPWAVLTLGVNVPTGTSARDGEEALVASALSTELLGFREASWGLGFAATTGVVTAHRVGDWGVGFGASYRHAADYAPSVADDFQYNPGDEVRLRLALDRNFGANKLTLGLTFQNYAEDRIDGQNLFQPGRRWRGDASWAFPAGAGALTAYTAAAWRQRGDVFFDLATGQPTTGTVGGQRLAVAGLTGSVPVSPTLTVMPAADVRWIDRDERGGDGWMAGIGLDLPVRAGSAAIVPGGRVRVGALKTRPGESRTIYGAEAGLTIRFGR